MQLIINEYLSKNQSKLPIVSGCLNFCYGRMLTGLGLGLMALASRVQALRVEAVRFGPCLDDSQLGNLN